MKIIKTKIFAKWADKNKISEQSLVIAANEIALELYEANYGGGVLKKEWPIKEEVKVAAQDLLWLLKKGKIVFLYMVLKRMKKAISLQTRKKLLKLSLNLY